MSFKWPKDGTLIITTESEIADTPPTVLVPAPDAASTKKDSTMGLQIAVSGLSVATATCVTNPIDVVKTRLQLQTRVATTGNPLGMFGLMFKMGRTEGLAVFWQGIVPATLRGLTYGGLRLGLYEPIKEAVQQMTGQENGSTFATKMLAGTLSGGLAAALTSPSELIKTRMQSGRGEQLGAWQTARHVVKQGGIPGLWRGGVPGVVRASLLTASQCATYDVTKREVMRIMGWEDHAGTQVACALITGLVSTTITNPADVVKTAMYVGGGQRGALAAARSLVAAEGPAALLKGWTANYSRLGPQTLVVFLVAERLRQVVGLNSL